MDKLTEMKQERASLVKKQRKLFDKVEDEERNFSSEEQKKWDRMDEEIDDLEDRIEKLQRTREREKNIISKESDKKNNKGDVEYSKAFDKWSRKGRSALDRAESRALQEDTDTEGGHLVPTEFANSIMQALEERNIMRQIATVSSTSSPKKIPVASDAGAATWVAEEGAYQFDDPSFTQKSIDAYKAGTIIKISEELLYDNDYNLKGYIQGRFVRRIGDLEETAFVGGNGTGKPTGFLNDADNATTATAVDAVTADELIDLFHGPKTPYRKNGNWVMNDSTAKAVRKLKDGNGQYMWQPGLQAGQPDVLLGRPVRVAGDMPDLATGNKPIAFGDFSFYEIFDREGIFMQRLNELYAENGQIGFRAYKRVDGLLMLAEAVQTITMA